MPDNTLTLRMVGEVSLDKFAAALSKFRSLVTGLAAARHARDVRWVIEDLRTGSAITTVAGIGDINLVVEVADLYLEVGDALRTDTIDRYPPRVRKPAQALRSYVGNGVESVTFEAAERDVIIQAVAAPAAPEAPAEEVRLASQRAPSQIILPPGRILPPAYGAISGQVETIARRGSLRFVLYEVLHNKAVSCYLAEGQDREEMMRGVWGHYATVEGLVTRDPNTGRPLSIRQITHVSKSPDHPGSYREARGASPYDRYRPEELIRRVRDAW
jgi:hypothetical protein